MQAISEIRTDHVLNMAGGGTKDFNCWGATQYVLRARDTLGWVEVKEMASWIRGNTKEVKQASTGDILVLWKRGITGKALVHTAVYLGDGQYLHKIGSRHAERTSKMRVVNHYKNMIDGHEIRRLTCE